MNIHYPNGRKFMNQLSTSQTVKARKDPTYSNRGMTLEEDLNETNEFYLLNNIAVIHKKPTPVQIVEVNYPKRSAAVINYRYGTGLNYVA